MAMLAVAFPLLPGKTEQWRRFTAELRGARNAEYRASRARLGVHERTLLQHTPQGDVVIVTLEGDDPAGAFAALAQQSDPFTQWFLAQVQEAHGVDLRQPPPGPLPELLIDSRAA